MDVCCQCVAAGFVDSGGIEEIGGDGGEEDEMDEDEEFDEEEFDE